MENNKTVLLVMDMQSSILSTLPNSDQLISNVAQAIAKARKHNIPVIYVVVGFRHGLPEISMNNKSFSAIRERMAGVDVQQWMKIHPEIAPQQHDIVVTKRRVSAFSGSDLEVVLRGQNASHLVLTGIATSGVVLSTFCEASDKDFQLTVIEDCCADRDEEVHRVLTTKVFPRQAEVAAVSGWLS